MTQDMSWPDVSGRLIEDAEGPCHQLPVRVYFEDTDAGGVVYHASYVRFCERGRTDYLRLLGIDARAMITGEAVNGPAVFVVRRMSLEFLRPARMDDLLLVKTRVKEIGGASLTLTQEVSRDGRPVFSAEVVVVLVSVAGKPMRLTDMMRGAFRARA
ncbi:MAG: tol-pal system-associated acyl-CoA thioesterase [Hyphomicrobiaceae bacterium]|nr:tol-pal system-associated acyl-CoA thioesterase [Hyphomicrobiaceae bacterium]